MPVRVGSVVDTARQTITIATAGHPPPLLRARGETSRLAYAHGVMLGVLPQARYTNLEVGPCGPGDRLLLYSDGVTEARSPPGEFFEIDRVARWLPDVRHASAEQFAGAALRELRQWTAGAFEDDVTFVIAELKDVQSSDFERARASE